MQNELTPKQQRFAAEYLVDFNPAQAAIRAGYSQKTAKSQGAKMLADDKVSAEISRLVQLVPEQFSITRESVMRELAAVGFANLADFVRVKTLAIPPGEGQTALESGGLAEETYQVVETTDTDKLPAYKSAALAQIKQGSKGIEVKLHDKVRALELLGKAMGIFEGKNTVPEASCNLLEAILGAAGEDIDTDDIPEIDKSAEAEEGSEQQQET